MDDALDPGMGENMNRRLYRQANGDDRVGGGNDNPSQGAGEHISGLDSSSEIHIEVEVNDPLFLR